MIEFEKPDDGLRAMIKKAINPKQDDPAEEVTESEAVNEPEPEDATPAPEPITEPTAPATVERGELQPLSELPQETPAATPQSRARTADELQALILDDLTKIPDAPKRGMTVTVYGYHPWNAMVSFAPGSTKASTATIIRSALIRVVDEMRKTVDIEMPRD